MSKVPFMDLKRQYERIRGEIDEAIARTLQGASFIGGPDKEAFEKEFAAACGAKFCVGVANGTDSLFLILKAAGLGAGAEVLVPANSFIATSEMVTAAGATPVFVDVDETTFNLDLNRVEELFRARGHKAGGKIRAVIPVHLYGRMVDMDRLMDLCRRHEIFCLEDSAQAHGARWKGGIAGSLGHAGSFSFYPGKNLGAYGDAGAVTTNDEELATRVRKLANHGRIAKYDHDIEGYNSRLDGLQAAVLRVKLRHLTAWTETRKDRARRYDQLLKDTPKLILPELPPREEHVFHLYTVRVPKRDQVHAELKNRGIEASVHYPVALPFLKAYERFQHRPADFPVAARLQGEILSLPFFPEMTDEEQDRVAATLKEVLSSLSN
ncbi:MAG: DegT/DnrJ/EryC1/StrS family aminotransferase [Bdellovibrionaceae bacterium]|nr:DegT/DnrJ/EryC1/StrS family aminotransferase [Pseudobdellovibrionaceae bacterium]